MTEGFRQFTYRPFASMYNSAGYTHGIGDSGAFRRATWDTVILSRYGIANTTNNRFEIPVEGIYRVTIHLEYAGNSGGNRREIRFKQNETYTGVLPDGVGTVLANQLVQNKSASAVGMGLTWTGPLDAGDVVHAEIYQNSGASLAINAGLSLTWFAIYWLGASTQ